MDSILKEDVAVVVLSDESDAGASSYERGHLFELFCARLLELFGYENVKKEKINVTSEGIEIDLVVTHKVSKRNAIVECKAYSKALGAKEMMASLEN